MSYDVQNPEKLLIVLSSDIYIENISFYALNTSKLKFGCYLTFEFTFLALSYSLVPVFCYCFTSKLGKISRDCIWNSLRNKLFFL